MSNVESEKCNYDGCNLPINSPYDNEKCIWHCKLESKGISREEFASKLRELKIYKHDTNFNGFIFFGVFDYFLENLSLIHI